MEKLVNLTVLVLSATIPFLINVLYGNNHFSSLEFATVISITIGQSLFFLVKRIISSISGGYDESEIFFMGLVYIPVVALIAAVLGYLGTYFVGDELTWYKASALVNLTALLWIVLGNLEDFNYYYSRDFYVPFFSPIILLNIGAIFGYYLINSIDALTYSIPSYIGILLGAVLLVPFLWLVLFTIWILFEAFFLVVDLSRLRFLTRLKSILVKLKFILVKRVGDLADSIRIYLFYKLLGGLTERYIYNPLLRMQLVNHGVIPLRYKVFLNYASQIFLLKSNGSEYEFIHRVLRDHFALLQLVPSLKNCNVEEKIDIIQKISLQGDASVETLAELATDSNVSVRIAAITGLGRIATVDAVRYMKRSLQEDREPIVRRTVLESTNRLALDDVVAVFDIAVKDSSPEVRAAVVANIGRLADATSARDPYEYKNVASNFVRTLLSDNDQQIFTEIACACGKHRTLDISERIWSWLDLSMSKYFRTALEDERVETRKGAALILGILGDQSVGSYLLKGLNNPQTSDAYVEALVMIGDESAIPTLLKLIDDRKISAYRRLFLLFALSKFKEERAMPYLLRFIHGEGVWKQWKVIFSRIVEGRWNCKRAIIALGEYNRSIFAALYLIEAATIDISRDVRIVATTVLRQFGYQPHWLSKLKRAEVRLAVAILRKQIAKHSTTEARLNATLSSPNPIVRVIGVTTLGRIGKRQAVPLLRNALADSNADVRTAIAAALGEIHASIAVLDLMNLLNDESPEVQLAAVIALGRIGDPSVELHLLDLLETDSVELRAAIITALGHIQSVAAVPNLLNFLHHQSEKVRLASVAALGEIKASVAIPDLIEILQEGLSKLDSIVESQHFSRVEEFIKANVEMFWTAAGALKKIGTLPIPPEWLSGLENKSGSTRRVLEIILGQMGIIHAVPGLIEQLDHSQFSEYAAKTLQNIGTAETLEIVQRWKRLSQRKNFWNQNF